MALGGNALLQRGEALTAKNQYRNIASAVPQLAPGPFLSAGNCSRQRTAGGAVGVTESGVERGRTVFGCTGGEPGDDWLYAGAELERTAADAACHDGADAH